MTKKIAQQLGYSYVFFPSFGNGRDYVAGNAIISKFPLYGIKSYKLNRRRRGSGNEARILVTSKIKVGNQVINFLVTHLQPSIEFKSTKVRYSQVRKVISVTNKIKNAVILTGDFNSLLTNGELKLLGRKLNRIGNKRPTWPSVPFDYKDWHINKPRYRPDNIYISKDLRYENFQILKSKLSDHFPIKADILTQE